MTTPRALFLQKSGIPYLYFPPYDRAEAISLISRSAPVLAPQRHIDEFQDLPTLQKWYSLFATTVYDSLFSSTSLSLSCFQRTCETLWPRFIWPYLSGEQAPGKGRNAQWDFPKLLVRQRTLFQTAGGETLAARLLPKAHAATFEELQQEQAMAEEFNATEDVPISRVTSSTLLSSNLSHHLSTPIKAPILSLVPTLVLTAAYLASHTPPKLDILLFSRLSSSSRSARIKKNYHRRKLFQSPSKHRGSSTAADGGGGGSSTTPRLKKVVAVGKSGLEMNLNLPRTFTLERLVAIFRAVHPAGVSGRRSVVDKVGREIAELERLRLIVATDGAGAGGTFGTRALLGDDGGEEKRWRVNVPRAFVEEMGAKYQREGVSGLIREFELVEG